MVAQWLERATDDRVVAGSNPTEAVWKLWQFLSPHFASVFRKRHYKPEMCNLSWTPYST